MDQGDYKVRLANCRLCRRLVEHHKAIRLIHPNYFAAPVPIWGDQESKILIVGLAPGLHGASRTGRAFVGDSSGEFLFASLFKFGWATSPKSDEAMLQKVMITNAVKCLPPANKPMTVEEKRCSKFLEEEIVAFRHNGTGNKAILCLGGVAFKAVAGITDSGERIRFGHGVVLEVSKDLKVFASYHPSRLNVNTGRLNSQMFNSLLDRIDKFVGISGYKDQSIAGNDRRS